MPDQNPLTQPFANRLQKRPTPLSHRDALIAAGVDPLLARLQAARGVTDSTAQATLAHLTPFQGMMGIERAAVGMANALVHQVAVTCLCDYDVDGSSAAAILWLGLKEMGLEHLEVMVPNRVTDGYGITPALVERMDPKTRLVITVDNGIAAHAGIDAAKARGFQVIVTDHHLAGETLPKADAIVNPNQPGCPFPWKSTCGAGVAWYLLLATRARLKAMGRHDLAQRLHPTALLDLVALATVADVVPLEFNNRILIHEGLRRIRAGQMHTGLRALLEVAGKAHQTLTAQDLAFALAPRINAAGRLDDMGTGIRLLTTDDWQEAQALAAQLDTINRARRTMEDGIRESAQSMVDAIATRMGGQLPPLLCVFDPSWHEGVVGIVAGRLKETYYRPALVFGLGADEMIKGSARSIPGLHIRDLIAEVDALHPGLIHKFGGHAMAAGLTLPQAAFSTFQRALLAVATRRIKADLLEETVWHDGTLEDADRTLAKAAILAEWGVWGNEFPEPRFTGRFTVVKSATLTGGHWRLTLRSAPGSSEYAAIYFLQGQERDTLPVPPAPGAQIEGLYTLQVNRWQQRDSVQLLLTQCWPVPVLETCCAEGPLHQAGAPVVEDVDMIQF